MNYRINGWVLNCQLRQLSKDGKQQQIRPRTMALLLFFIEHQNELLSTTLLLRSVWDDVEVNEGVVFQSIREIRRLFGDNNVIVNFPRKGYQFVAEVIPCEGSLLQKSPAKRIFYSFCLVLMFAVSGIFIYFQASPDKSPNVDVNIHSPGLELEIDEALLTSSLSEHLQQTQTDLKALAVDVYRDIFGLNVMYTARLKERELEGIIFLEKSTTLISSVIDDIKLQLDARENTPLQLRWNKEFIKAFLVYETDWKAATSVFKSLHSRFPKNVRLTYLLVKLDLWNGRLDAAQALIDSVQLDPLEKKWQAIFYHVQALLYFKLDQSQFALSMLEKAESLALAINDWEILAILSDLQGDICYQRGQYEFALRAFQRAESLYLQVNGVTGLATVRLKMTVLYIATKQKTLARITFEKARKSIEEQQLSFLYTMQTTIWDANHNYLMSSDADTEK